MVVQYNTLITPDTRYISGVDWAQANIPGNYPTALFILPYCSASQADFDAIMLRADRLAEKWGLFRASIRFAAGLRCYSWSGLRAFEMDGVDIIGVDTHPALQRALDVLTPHSWIIRAYNCGVPMQGAWRPAMNCERLIQDCLTRRRDIEVVEVRNTKKPFAKTYASDYFRV